MPIDYVTGAPGDVTSPVPDTIVTPPAAETVPVQIEDPATCPILPGRETIIEIQKGKTGLGLSIIGGADTLLVSTGWSDTVLLEGLTHSW